VGPGGPVDNCPLWCGDLVRLPTGEKWDSPKLSAPSSAPRNRGSGRVWICRGSNEGTQLSPLSRPGWSFLELVTVCSDHFWWGGDVLRVQRLPGGIFGGRSTRPDDRRPDCRQRAWCRPLRRKSGSFTVGNCRRISRVDCHRRQRDFLESKSSRSGGCLSDSPSWELRRSTSQDRWNLNLEDEQSHRRGSPRSRCRHVGIDNLQIKRDVSPWSWPALSGGPWVHLAILEMRSGTPESAGQSSAKQGRRPRPPGRGGGGAAVRGKGRLEAVDTKGGGRRRDGYPRWRHSGTDNSPVTAAYSP
jgi:hypothetical protein